MSSRRPPDNFLRMLDIRGCSTWGYTVYRTVYTPESEAQWPSIMAVLGSYIRKSIYEDLHLHEIYPEQFVGRVPPDPTPNQKVWDMFRWDVVSDETQFDGATLEAVRAHFQQGLKLGEWDAKCFMIDEEAFKFLKDLPIPKDDEEDMADVWVKVVDPRWKSPEDSDNPRYKGWMRVKVGMLWDFWSATDRERMDLFFHPSSDEEFFIYMG